MTRAFMLQASIQSSVHGLLLLPAITLLLLLLLLQSQMQSASCKMLPQVLSTNMLHTLHYFQQRTLQETDMITRCQDDHVIDSMYCN